MATAAPTLTFQPNGHAVPQVPTGWRLFQGVEIASLYGIDPWGGAHSIYYARPDGARAFAPADLPQDMFARLIAVGFGTAGRSSREPWAADTLTAAYDALPAYRKAMCLPPDVREHEKVESIRRALRCALPMLTRAEDMIQQRRLIDRDIIFAELATVIAQLGDHVVDAAHICDGRPRGGSTVVRHDY